MDFSRGRSGGLVCLSLSEFSSLLWSTQSKALAEIDVFLELSCFFHDPEDVGNLISVSSAFSKASLNTWKFSVHVLLKPGLKNFEHYFASVWGECNCAVVWTLWHCLSLGLEWKLNFSSPVATAEFSKFDGISSAALSQHHLRGFEKSSTGIPSPPLALFIVMLPKAPLDITFQDVWL